MHNKALMKHLKSTHIEVEYDVARSHKKVTVLTRCIFEKILPN